MLRTIGIIGGGQLGRMLAMAAGRLGFRTVILDPDQEAPAAQMANRHIIAAYDDEKALRQLAESVDVVTYEFENIPYCALNAIKDKTVYPSPMVLKISQDRVDEKQYLNAQGIPTSRWCALTSDDEIERAVRMFGGQAIVKTRRLGYDGKGQCRVNVDDPSSLAKARSLVSKEPTILEAVVDFTCEISVIGARNASGETVCFDAVENIHEAGILRRSIVPARVSAEIVARAQSVVRDLLLTLDYVGVLAVEFFVLADGQLLANEIAPRVHNSGHWTEAACLISQFEQHIRAVAGLPLGNCVRHSNCVMENIIGDEINNIGRWLASTNCLVHLYGKREIKAGRKMGHVTHLVEKLE